MKESIAPVYEVDSHDLAAALASGKLPQLMLIKLYLTHRLGWAGVLMI